jgi:two-component system response regulator FixJ
MNESKIYIIDDNEAVCQALKFLFVSFYNFNVAVYHNPLLFLEEFSVDWRGCLIIDLHMPAMNGLDLIKELKRCNNKMNIIVMSGNGSTVAAEQSLDAGACVFITKPFKTDYLLEQVKIMLQLNS